MSEIGLGLSQRKLPFGNTGFGKLSQRLDSACIFAEVLELRNGALANMHMYGSMVIDSDT
jgi:hypothetical protein